MKIDVNLINCIKALVKGLVFFNCKNLIIKIANIDKFYNNIYNIIRTKIP